MAGELLCIDLSCCCGARLTAAARWPSDVRHEREAFNARHADCQPPVPVPPVRVRIPIARRRA